jgi:L-threonylcarbamoyladenylate synthase
MPPLAAQFPMVASAQAYAHDLYAALRNMDHAAADLIVVEAPPSGLAWQGINDRLRRAAHDSSAVLAGFKK